MKALIRSGLSLALALGVSTAFAEEIPWRASSPAGASATASGRVSLGRPAPLAAPGAGDANAAVRPASFRPVSVFRANIDDNSKPLPVGPVVKGEPTAKQQLDLPPEPIPVHPSGGTTSFVVGDGVPVNGADCCVISGDCCSTGMCGSWFDCWSGCCPPRANCFWVRAEYLLWDFSGQDVPPLVTTSPAGTPRAGAGVLGVPTTGILFGGDELDTDMRSGGRFTFGFWFPRHSDLGLEASYLFIGRRHETFAAASAGDPILARPIINAVTGAPEAQLVAFPGVVTGGVVVDHSSRLWGLEANLRKKLHCGPCYHVDLLFGYRHLNLEEDLSITENLTALDPQGGASTGFIVTDRFGTENRFNGGQIGVEAEWRFWRRWFAGVQAKVALGTVEQVVNISGQTQFFPPAPAIAVTREGGLLALPTNIGRHSNTHFAVVPEVALKLGFDVTDHLRLYVAYDVLYFSNVVRAGEQIDLQVNRSQIPNLEGTQQLVGARRPAVLFQQSDFWAQGVNFGLEYRY